MKNIGQNLIAARLRQGLTQKALAQRCGIAQPNIAAFERGVRQPSLASLGVLAEALQEPLETLLAERREAQGLTRYDFEALAKGLALGQNKSVLDPRSWRDLQALFHTKLKALYPGPRQRPRISAYSALRRLQALHTRSFIDRLNGRFSKLNLERS